MEAKKFTENIFKNVDTHPSVIILLGPALNYMLPFIHEYFTESKILVLHFDDKLYLRSRKIESPLIKHWHPGSYIRLKTFLYRNIDESVIFDKLLVKWEPSFKAFPDSAKYILDNLNQVLNEYSCNINTTKYFGRRYIKNIIRNIMDLEEIAVPFSVAKPVVITASGASLGKSIDAIKEIRKKIFLISLSSASILLKNSRVVPDLIITTDPGFYSIYHMMHSTDKSSITAAPLSSYPGIMKNRKILILNQGSFLENYFLELSGYPCLRVNTNGTVAGSAAYLANLLTEKPVVFAGLDFCTSDILSHSIPNSLDYITKKHSSRLNPLYSSYFKEASSSYPYLISDRSRYSSQLSAYTRWFNTTNLGGNCYRLNKSAIDISSLKPVDNADFFSLINNHSVETSSADGCKTLYIDRKHSELAVKNALDKLTDTLSGSLDIIHDDINLNELFYFFDPDTYFKMIIFKNKKEWANFRQIYHDTADKCISFISKIKKQVLNE